MAKKRTPTPRRTSTAKKAASRGRKAAKAVRKVARTVRKAAKATPAKARKRVKKTVRKAVKKTVTKSVTKSVKKAVKKAVRKLTRKAQPKKPPAKAARAAAKTRKAAPSPEAAPRTVAPKARRAAAPPPPPHLNRERRRLPEADLFDGTGSDDRLLSSARAGHDEFVSELRKHTEGSLELTAGDVDAKWQDAYAVGDEAPGGDNPTPDQDRVDDIGRALGVEYDDDEELMGGGEISERDEHRWELNPASKDDDDF
jgi:hypothetical protein